MFGPTDPDPCESAAPVPLTVTALWDWLMKHGAQDWHTTAERLTRDFTITRREQETPDAAA